MGWSYGNALVGEFMFTFLLVFTVFQTAANSDFDYLSVASFVIGLAVFPASDLISRSSCRGVVHWRQEGHLPAHVGLRVWTICRRLLLHQALLFRRVRPSFVAMTLLVILGPGSAIGIVNTEVSAWVLWVSLTSGFAVATLFHAISTCSNQINCAVTFVFVAVVKFLRLAMTSQFRCSVVEVTAWCCQLTCVQHLCSADALEFTPHSWSHSYCVINNTKKHPTTPHHSHSTRLHSTPLNSTHLHSSRVHTTRLHSTPPPPPPPSG